VQIVLTYQRPKETKKMSNSLDTIAPLREFVIGMTKLVSEESEEKNLIPKGSQLLKSLIQSDSWLPEFCTVPHPEFYQQFLLHADPLGRFSVVSFVWGPGQKTPIHDHCVWGLIGMLRGMEKGQRYKQLPSGDLVIDSPEAFLRQGEIEAESSSGFDDGIQRAVRENCDQLKFKNRAFED
jgi:predicted metal-dependent enzyme (double-stranded beta helix superfamily)